MKDTIKCPHCSMAVKLPHGNSDTYVNGLIDSLLRARDEAQEAKKAITWKPIETAPRDGRSILVAHNHWGTVNVTIATWGRVNYGAGQFEDGWRSFSGFLTGGKWWCEIPSVESLQKEENAKEEAAQSLNRLSQ